MPFRQISATRSVVVVEVLTAFPSISGVRWKSLPCSPLLALSLAHSRLIDSPVLPAQKPFPVFFSVTKLLESFPVFRIFVARKRKDWLETWRAEGFGNQRDRPLRRKRHLLSFQDLGQFPKSRSNEPAVDELIFLSRFFPTFTLHPRSRESLRLVETPCRHVRV